ncbi:Inositol transporter 1 [Galdieria sulphuraria]|nr:Inositol transporter 1 [Galdieria sulphuraria]
MEVQQATETSEIFSHEQPSQDKDKFDETEAHIIDAGVYFEADDAKFKEELEQLERELMQSGKKPYFAARFFKEPKKFIWFLASLASIGGFLFGVDQSLISGASLYIPSDLHIDSSRMSMIVGFTPLGAIFGALIIMPTNDLFGRKYAIVIASILFTVGAILEADAHSFGVLLPGRMILGSALGLLSGTVPAYIAENCAVRWRVWKHARGFDTYEERKEFFVMERVVLYELEQARNRLVLLDFLRRPRCLRALIVAVIYQLGGQQMSGVNSIEYYQASLMEETGLTAQKAVYSSLIGGGVMFLSTIPAIYLMDRLGRRSLTLTLIPGVCIGLFITGFSFQATALGVRLGIYLWGMITYTIFWSSGLGPGPWVFASEVYPTYLRSYGVSIAALCDWTGTFITTYPFKQMSEAMTSTGVFAGFYCGIVILVGILLLLFMPETKNLTLEEINEVFERPAMETMKINWRSTKETWHHLLHFQFDQVWKLS